MELKQVNKSRMYGATDLVLDNNKNSFITIPELVSAHQELKQKKSVIDKNRQEQETDHSGLTKIKMTLREVVIITILRFSGAMTAYAASINDDDLRTKVNYTPSYLEKTSDPILFDIATLIFNLATPLTAELQKFFIGTDEFQRFDQLIPDFKAAIPQKRVAGTGTKVSTSNIDFVFKEIDQLLKSKIDLLMKSFQFVQPDFYNAYKNARIIVDYGGNGKKKKDEKPPV